jgi:hypothetical protein
MTPADIVAEHRCGHTPRQENIDWFLSRDVPVLALARSYGGEFDFLLMADVIFLGDGHFDFARDCPEARDVRAVCTFLVRDAAGDVADIVAWSSKFRCLASWLGRAALLGEEQLWWPRLGDPLIVHADPLSWLQASRRGVVVVNPVQAAPLLREAGTLGVAKDQHGRKLRALVRQPPVRILVAA